MRLDRQRERTTRLVVAESDMKQVEVAAAHLASYGAVMKGNAERVLQTGIIVTYARPFAESRRSMLGAIKGKLATPDDPVLSHLHVELLARRKDVFAHNDATQWRGSIVGLSGRHVKEWAPIERSVYPHIERLAAEQRERFRRRLDGLEKELGRA